MNGDPDLKLSKGPDSVVIVDYGMGNVRSIECALRRLGCSTEVTHQPDRIRDASALILPGVGAFGKAMENLQSMRLTAALDEAVIRRKTPILGICLGMQLFAESSSELGEFPGLGWIPGTVTLLRPGVKSFPIPHVGWNDIRKIDETMFNRIADDSHFYFDHSYFFRTNDEYFACTVNYGTTIAAAIRNQHIWGTQFHPEKSQTAGLRLLRNFLNYVGAEREC